MFSSSLRGRSIWRVLEPLLDTATDGKLQESCLDTHDFAFYIPCINQEVKKELRVVLLSPSSLQDTSRQDTLARIETMSRQDKKSSTTLFAIIFLHSEEVFNSASGKCKMNGLMSLQVLLLESLPAPYIPIIPVSEPSTLFPSVQGYLDILARAPPQLGASSSSSTALSLLAHVTANGPSLLPAQHEINVLSDLFPSLCALASAIRTQEGRKLLIGYLDDRVTKGIVDFWEVEQRCD